MVAWFSKIFFTVFSIFKVIVFQKSTEFELEFAMRIPVVKLIYLDVDWGLGMHKHTFTRLGN